MWREWEKFKVALEASRAPEMMLICDKWEQLKFVSRESFARSVLKQIVESWGWNDCVHRIV